MTEYPSSKAKSWQRPIGVSKPWNSSASQTVTTASVPSTEAHCCAPALSTYRPAESVPPGVRSGLAGGPLLDADATGPGAVRVGVVLVGGLHGIAERTNYDRDGNTAGFQHCTAAGARGPP